MSLLKNINLFLFFAINLHFYHNFFSHGCADHNKPDVKNLDTNDMKLICYYGSWSVYRPGNGKFPVENIDPFLCSHLIYSFAGLGYDYRIKSLDPYYDLKENYGKGAFERFNNLKNTNKNLKTLIAIGGWNEGSIKYSNMAAQPEARKIFIESVVNFIEKYGFDGLDLDWEYPASRGGKPEDKTNYVSLLRELKEAFTPRGYLLTAAVSAGKWFIDPAYDIPQVSQYLDIINVMCYDYHGGWENKTGHNSPLYPRPDELDDPTDRLSNVNFSINYWISKGAPKSKIVMGMGTYGRSFTLQKADMNKISAPAPQKGQAGPYTREAGSLGYNEICEMRKTQTWTEVRDPYYLAPYIYKDRQWVGYDDVESITIKAEYIKAMQLAGGMIWSVETDDFAGRCGPKYPLLNAIQKTFKSAKVNMPMPGAIETEDEVPSSSSSAPSSTQTASSWTWSKPTMSTQPWVWVRPSTSTSSTPQSSITTSSSTTTSTSSPQWPWASSSSPSPQSPSSSPSSSSTTTTTTKWPWVTSSQWPWASSSSTTKWPWAATHPPSSASTSVMPDSSSTTEAANNTTPDSNVKFVCQSAGMFRHPNDCQKFYRCVQTLMEGSFSAYEYKCPDRTVFNIKTNLCDWWKNVSDCPNNGTRNTRTNRF